MSSWMDSGVCPNCNSERYITKELCKKWSEDS